MRVFVAGATGVLGKRVVGRLLARGHDVVGLARSEKAFGEIKSLGAEPRMADLFDAAEVTNAASGCDVIVRAATSIPTKVRTSARDWVMNDRIRREGTRVLVSAAKAVRARGYVQESVVWDVRGREGEPFDETAPPVNDAILASALDAERIAENAGDGQTFQAATLRFGSFYSADSWHTRILRDSLARARPVLVGSGDPIWTFIHADDAASAVVAAVERPRQGVWHVVDDRPAALREFLSTLAQLIGARPPRRAPRWLARLVLGRSTSELLTSSFITNNERFSREVGWRPAYPVYADGLRQVVSEWRNQGWPSRKS